MRAVAATIRGAITEAVANRTAFWSQVTVMVVNDLAWVVFWVLFFRRVGTVRGWDADKVLLLLAILTTSAGFVLGFLANARRIGNLAVDGGLDAVLALPVPPLAHLLVRRIETVNIGDVAFGVVLFAAAGSPTPQRLATYVVCSAAAAVLMTGFLITTGSVAFFTGRGEVGDLGLQAMLLLGSYPVDVFAGTAKILLFTVVPAAFVAAVPARLVDSFNLPEALALVGAAAFFAVTGVVTFTLGLRRYTSGSLWTRA